MNRVLIDLARLLEYPGADLADCVTRLRGAWTEFSGHASGPVPGESLLALSTDQREELYTSTFDVTPRCVPYLSIHLFGEENFKRGELMAALHARHAQLGLETRGELPDHIALVLHLATLIDEDERRELVALCLLGPLAKMIDALPEEHPYRPVLQAVQRSLQAAHPDLQAAPSPRANEAVPGQGCLGCGSVVGALTHG